MKTETYLDKTPLGPGPWQEEPDRAEWRDPETGLTCLAVRQDELGHWCGYVAVPPGHPAHGKDYGDVAAGVHGGLTYAAACADRVCHVPEPGEPDDVWWLGFDCCHSGDLSPGVRAALGRARANLAEAPALVAAASPGAGRGFRWTETYRTLDYVRLECADLARQLAALGAG